VKTSRSKLYEKSFLIKRYLNLRTLISSIVFMIGIIMLNIMVNPRTIFYINAIVLTAIPLAFLGLAELFVLLTGEVDISVGAGLTLANVIPVYAYLYLGIDDFRFCLIHIAVGLALGFINGILVGLLRIKSFLATLATSFVWTGLALIVLNKPEGPVPEWFAKAFSRGIFGIPMTVIGLLLLISIWLLFRFHVISLHFYAVGSDPYASYIAGINVNLIKLYAFTLNGFMIGLSALFMTGIINSGDPRIGLPFMLSAILAAILAGARFTGGTGDGIAVIAAAIGLTFMRNLLFSLGIPFYQQDLAYSIIVLGLIAVVMYLRRMR